MRSMRKKLPKKRVVILLARPRKPPRWWPKEMAGWVTVNRDLDGWTSGIHGSEGFLSSQRDIEDRQQVFDEDLGREHEYRLAPPWAVRQWAITGIVGEEERTLCEACRGAKKRVTCASCDGAVYLGFVDGVLRIVG